MKILMIAPTPFFAHRGTHIRILEEARALEARGHDVVITTYHVGDDIHDYIDTNIDVRRIRRWLFWYKKTDVGGGGDWQKALLDFFLIRKSFYMTRTWKPDVIHAHLHEGVLIGEMMQKLFFWRKIKLVSDFHGSLVNEMISHDYFSRGFVKRFFSLMEWWISGMGDAAVVSSKENIPAITNARSDNTATHVYDGVDVKYYDQLTADKATLRKKYQIPRDAFVLVYTGSLIDNKGVGHVVHALKAITQQLPYVHIVIGGYPAGWVRRHVAKHNLTERVTVISPLNYFSLPEVNALADVAIDPKCDDLRQASGKILQYMAARLPVLCIDRPTNRIYAEEGGYYLKELSSKMIVGGIRTLHDDKALREKKSMAAYERAQIFSWHKVGEKLEELYHQ